MSDFREAHDALLWLLIIIALGWLAALVVEVAR